MIALKLRTAAGDRSGMMALLPVLTVLAALPLPAEAQTVPHPAPAPAPPPVLIAPVAPPVWVMPSMVHYAAALVRCGSEEVHASVPVTPYEAVSWRGAELARGPVVFTFRIDASGRPLSIRVDGTELMPDTDDLAPALAATRFSPGPQRRGCTATYNATVVPLDAAPKAQLYRYYGMPHRPGPFERRVYNALKPAGSNCDNPPIKPRTINFPDFDAIPQAPGTASHVVISYDLDAGGRPVNVRVMGSEGNAALDRAGVAAISTSRFAPEARTGCVVRFDRRQDQPLEAPTPPETAAYKTAAAQCRNEPSWASMPRLVFPERYNRRAIEGWAIVAYDVAPSGETGKLRVLASEPSADFGKAALPIVAGARQAPSARGFTGCVARVLFVLPPEGAPEPEEDADDE